MVLATTKKHTLVFTKPLKSILRSFWSQGCSITKANRNDTFAFAYESTVALRFILRGSYEVL